MKVTAIALSLLAIASAARADIVAKWDFNGTFDSTSPVPTSGSGTASRVGGTSGSSAGGSTNDAGANNNAWNTAAYPAQGTASKTAGVKFAVNTTGYTNIVVSWDQRESNTGSKYSRFQYTLNGTDWIDGSVVVVTNPTSSITTWYSQINDLSAVGQTANNPNFAFRIVTEWQSTAAGSGGDTYAPAFPTSTYGTAGTIRFDLVTVSGTLVGTANTPPIMSALTNQITRVNEATNQAFTVFDLETAGPSLVVTGICSNPTLVPTANIVVTTVPDGTGTNRVVTVTPASGQTGTATITLSVVDAGTLYASRSYTLTVLPANTPPVLTGLVNTNTLVNTPVTIQFTIGDAETAAGSLTLLSNSTYTSILPLSGISFGGSGSNRSVTITPAANQTGVAAVTVGVSDGAMSTNITFAVIVAPAPSFRFFEPFSYNDGPLVGPNSGNLWQHHSGAVTGEVLVAGGTVTVDEIYGEDVSAGLIGAPYYATNAGALYTSCKATLNFLPTLGTNTPFGTYFLHFKDEGTVNFRARVIVTVTNAPSGQYRLAIANGTSTNIPDQHPMNLDLGVQYTIVTRYDLVSGLSTLWINPAAETDPSVTATDPVNLNSITAVALRENVSMGQVLVDDLIVATTFKAALGSTAAPTNTPPLIWPIASAQAVAGEASAPIPVTIGDAETLAGSLTLTATSSNQTLISDANIALGGSDSNRTIIVTPAAGQTGTASILVKVSDGVFTNQTWFMVSVNPSIVHADTFSYLDGSLVTNSSFLYTNFGGTNGDLRVLDGKASLTFRHSEDVAAVLTNGPFAPAGGVILYAGMTVNFSELPQSSYFAFFKDAASNFRGKVFATTSNAAPGKFRFAVMNTGSVLAVTNPVFSQDISLGETHRVILRYNVATGLSTLWVDPASEGDASITGNDFAGPISISTFALRQASGIGVLTLDDLLVGTTFQAVLGEGPQPELTAARTGPHSLTISWPSSATGYILNAATNTPAGPYAPYPDQGTTQGNSNVVNVTDSLQNVFFRLKK